MGFSGAEETPAHHALHVCAGLLRPGHPADAPPPEGALHPAAPELAAVAWREGFEAQVQALHSLPVYEPSVLLL